MYQIHFCSATDRNEGRLCDAKNLHILQFPQRLTFSDQHKIIESGFFKVDWEHTQTPVGRYRVTVVAITTYNIQLYWCYRIELLHNLSLYFSKYTSRLVLEPPREILCKDYWYIEGSHMETSFMDTFIRLSR